jgi:NAD kinase
MKCHFIKNTFITDKTEKYNKKILNFKQHSVEDCDIIVCGGGDGTLLHVIKDYKKYNKPFWGYNAGTLGFLMNNGFPWDFSEPTKMALSTIKAEVNYIKEVSSFEGGFTNVTETFEGVNDIMIGGDMNSYITFDVQEKDKILGNFKGGGLIISTPQGSTGVNKNNNGVILTIDSNLWSITGDKTDRRIEYVLEPRKIDISVNSRNPVTVWIDGSGTILEEVRHISISKGSTVDVYFGDIDEFKKKRILK